MLWLLEPDVFAPGDPPLEAAAEDAGHDVIHWRDDWWTTDRFPDASDEPVLFHGSLGNAARIAALGRWHPGAFCNIPRFRWSAWAPSAQHWLLNRTTVTTTVRALASDPQAAAAQLRVTDGRIFVRPDSPLKPFSGRVLSVDGLTPEKLDHGFYYEDLDLDIVVAPVVDVLREWRFVVAAQELVTGCEYVAQGRRAAGASIDGAATAFASEMAAALDAPDPVYVLDVAQTANGLRLVELNPFSGADLYACDPHVVVDAVARHV